MSTLGDMKAEIAGDLGRSDLTSYIETCIKRAIEMEQTRRYWFNQSRDMTFQTTAGRWRYSSFSFGPITSMEDLVEADEVWVEDLNGNRYGPLMRWGRDEIEAANDASAARNRPSRFAMFGAEMFLYPAPDKTYTVRVVGHYKLAAPSSDTETGNAWMTHAYRVILPLAKSLIYQSRIRNYQAAQTDYQTYLAERKTLLRDGMMKLSDNTIRPTWF